MVASQLNDHIIKALKISESLSTDPDFVPIGFFGKDKAVTRIPDTRNQAITISFSEMSLIPEFLTSNAKTAFFDTSTSGPACPWACHEPDHSGKTAPIMGKMELHLFMALNTPRQGCGAISPIMRSSLFMAGWLMA